MESGANRFGVGLLGHGTVGAAFAGLLPRHAERIERLTGLRPELAGILTRSSGSFDDLLERSELIVELIGGIDPAREWVLRAIEAGGIIALITSPSTALAVWGPPAPGPDIVTSVISGDSTVTALNGPLTVASGWPG